MRADRLHEPHLAGRREALSLIRDAAGAGLAAAFGSQVDDD